MNPPNPPPPAASSSHRSERILLTQKLAYTCQASARERVWVGYHQQHLELEDALLPPPPNWTVELSTCVAARASLKSSSYGNTTDGAERDEEGRGWGIR